MTERGKEINRKVRRIERNQDGQRERGQGMDGEKQIDGWADRQESVSEKMKVEALKSMYGYLYKCI